MKKILLMLFLSFLSLSLVSSQVAPIKSSGEYGCFGADTNQDGFVGYNDYFNWVNNFGLNCSISNEWCSGADMNRDKIIDDLDYLTLKQNYGRQDCNYGKIECIHPYVHDIPSDLIGSVKFSVSGKTANLTVDAMSSDGKRFTMNLPLSLIGGTIGTYGGTGSYMYGNWGNSFRTTSFKYAINSAGTIDLTMWNGVSLSIKNLKIV